jgi:hypothetical protein
MGHHSRVLFLIENGADLFTRDNEGMGILYYADNLNKKLRDLILSKIRSKRLLKKSKSGKDSCAICLKK